MSDRLLILFQVYADLNSYPVKYRKLPVNNVNPVTMCTKITNYRPFPRFKLAGEQFLIF